ENMDENELTPEERMAFQRLPRESEPSRILEERVVSALREEGILRVGSEASEPVDGGGPGRDGGGGRVPGEGRSRSGGLWLRPWMAAAAVAASLALFTSGIFLGQWMGTRTTAQAFLAVREQDATQLAMTIQEAGSQYVSALAALGELRISGSRESAPRGGSILTAADLEQGREVALGALYGAAYELARMSPDDPDVLRVLQILDERRNREEGYAGSPRNLVWF
ncbi:MAG: hypothetical protein ACWGSQ_09590, partial [Longimicrobiales bacterium]